MREVVSYIRVSTARQGASGLGLDGQRAAVRAFCKQHGCEVLKEFREIESGRKNDRAILKEAIAFAKRARATLVIAKLDRLARNVSFISGLMDSGVEFRACDLPEANRLLLHVMAAIAQHEAEMIAERTKAALKAAKANGALLGGANPRSRNLTPEAVERGRKKGTEATKERARTFYADAQRHALKLRDEGATLAEIAEELNDDGHRTQTGKRFGPVQVKRLLDRAK